MADQPLWTIAEIIEATGGQLEGDVTRRLDGVAIDSRAVGSGDIFVAIKGDRTDGHEYAASALKVWCRSRDCVAPGRCHARCRAFADRG